MSKQIKILLLLFVFAAVVFVLYFFKTAKPAVIANKQINKISEKINKKTDKIDLERVKAQYKNDVNNILSNYSNLIQTNNFTAAQIKSIKKQLLGLKVPSMFKDLHVNLVLAVTKMENFLSNGNSEDKFFSQKMINKSKKNYNWLK